MDRYKNTLQATIFRYKEKLKYLLFYPLKNALRNNSKIVQEYYGTLRGVPRPAEEAMHEPEILRVLPFAAKQLKETPVFHSELDDYSVLDQPVNILNDEIYSLVFYSEEVMEELGG
jgi:hypothetical protein